MADHDDGKLQKFDPSEHQNNISEAFDEFTNSFHYVYEAIAKEPPTSVDTAALKKSWIQQNKRKIFLGKFSTRALQKELEEVATAEEITTMTFDTMVTKLKTRFGLSKNSTMLNYKFRQISQGKEESFDQFVIRVKTESQGCNFKCESPACTVKDTMCRDQILLGTRDDDIRRQALHEEWSLDTLIKKGRSLEAATQGAEKIKKESNIKREEEGEYTSMTFRTQPKKYSKRYDPERNRSSRRKEDEGQKRCEKCSSRQCKGKKHCPGNKVTCFTCNQRGHYRGTKACTKHGYTRTRRLESENKQPSSDERHSST